MRPGIKSDQETIRQIRELIRDDFRTRDDLYAAAQQLDDDMIVGICRRLADSLGGQAVDLQQVLLMQGESVPAPESLPSKALEAVDDARAKERHRTEAVLSAAEACERVLKEEYEAAIAATANPDVGGMLRRHKENVEFGANVLHAVRHREDNPSAP